MALNLYEILEQINSKNTPDADIKGELRKYADSGALKLLLKMNYDMDFVGFDLPSGAPPYKFDPLEPYGYAETNLTKEIRKLYIFFNDYTSINRKRKEQLFIQLLEALHWREAQLLIAIKDKDLMGLFPCINECLIRETLPFWLNPITHTNYIDCAIMKGFGYTGDLENIVYSRYTIDEVKLAARTRTIVFRDYEHAKIAGISELSFDHVPEIDVTNNIEVILTKVVFGKELVIRTWVPIDNIAMSKKAAELRFVDIERARELGIDHFERNKWQEKLQGEAIRREAKTLAAEKGVPISEVKLPRKKATIPDIIRPPRALKPPKDPNAPKGKQGRPKKVVIVEENKE